MISNSKVLPHFQSLCMQSIQGDHNNTPILRVLFADFETGTEDEKA